MNVSGTFHELLSKLLSRQRGQDERGVLR